MARVVLLVVECPECGNAVALTKEGKLKPHQRSTCTGSHMKYAGCDSEKYQIHLSALKPS